MRRVVIADEQPIVRHALRQLLGEMGHEVVAERDDGTDALQDCLRLLPDLLILDLALPRLSGLEVVRRLRQRESRIAILVLTAQSSEHFAGSACRPGPPASSARKNPWRACATPSPHCCEATATSRARHWAPWRPR